MAKKYTADTFEGAVTGTASGNVAKTGDTMTGDLIIDKSSARLQLDGSMAGVINIRNGTGTYNAEGKITFGDDSASNTTKALIQSTSNPGSSELMLQYGTPVTNIYNQVKIRSTNTYFTDPIRLGADSTANELDDYEEGDWTPEMGGYFGGFTLNSYITQQGKYIKIGRVVHLFFKVEFTGVSSGSSNLVYLFGLPFSPSSDNSAYAGGSIGVRNKKNIDFIVSGQYDSLVGTSRLGTVGSTQMYFNMDNGVNTNTMRVNSLTGSNTDSMRLEGCITYRTSS